MSSIKEKIITGINIRKRTLEDFVRKNKQERYFAKQVNKNADRLIVFFIEGPWQKAMNEKISGGITSIESIYQRTREFKSIHNAEIVLCTLTGNRLFNFTTFASKARIIHYDLLSEFKNLKEVLIHIPEHVVCELLRQLQTGHLKQLLKAKSYQLNILNQNIDLMPEPGVVHELQKYFKAITQTTAHKNYNSDKFLAKYNIPYHFFSARIDISQYVHVPVEEKENLVLFSPDDRQKNKRVIELLQKALPGYKYQTIEDMTYSQYKERIGKAKFCFTFGEGLDGYFVEPFFSGTVSFAIYNEQFFRTAYKGLPSVFNNEDELFSTIQNVIAGFLNDGKYNHAVERTNALLNADYNYKDYVNNIRQYYNLYFKSAS